MPLRGSTWKREPTGPTAEPGPRGPGPPVPHGIELAQGAALPSSDTAAMDARRRFGRWALLAAVVLLSACGAAPLGRSVEQAVRIEVPGCPPVRCTLRNDLGEWVVESTPGQALVRTSARPLEVSCRRPEQSAATARLAPERAQPAEATTMAGAAVGAGLGAAAAAPAFALGGPFGFLAATLVVMGGVGGAAAGHAAGEASRVFSYPALVQVVMACPGPVPAAAELAAARWGLAVRAAEPGDGAPDGAVWIRAIDPGGAAAAAGLQAGDLLLAVDGRALDGTLALETALLRTVRDARAVTITVRRGATLVHLSLQGSARP
jgi:hypothetical protein